MQTTVYNNNDNNNLISWRIDNNVSPVDGKTEFKQRLPGERSPLQVVLRPGLVMYTFYNAYLDDE